MLDLKILTTYIATTVLVWVLPEAEPEIRNKSKYLFGRQFQEILVGELASKTGKGREQIKGVL